MECVEIPCAKKKLLICLKSKQVFLRCFFAAKSFTGILQNAPPTPWSFFARTDKSQAAQWQDPPRV